MEEAVSIYHGLQDRRLSVGDRPPDEPRVDDDVQRAEQAAVEMDRATPCPQDFSEKVWLMRCGERFVMVWESEARAAEEERGRVRRGRGT
jgi:hypothetical protein